MLGHSTINSALVFAAVVTFGTTLGSRDPGKAARGPEKRLLLESDLGEDVALLREQLTLQQSQIENLTALVATQYARIHDDADLTRNLTTVQKQLDGFIAMMKVQHGEVVTDMAAIDRLTRELADMQTEKVSGSTYTRWGRDGCPGNSTQLLYSGYMGGTMAGREGNRGGSPLCLTDEPLWDYYTAGSNHTINRVTGVQYRFYPYDDAATLTEFLGSDVSGGLAPCAICYVPRAATVVIPGRNQCYPGWKTEYQGYLVALSAGGSASDYVCLDRRPQAIAGGNQASQENGRNQLFFAESTCDGMQCPPYEIDRQLSCVVCSN